MTSKPMEEKTVYVVMKYWGATHQFITNISMGWQLMREMDSLRCGKVILFSVKTGKQIASRLNTDANSVWDQNTLAQLYAFRGEVTQLTINEHQLIERKISIQQWIDRSLNDKIALPLKTLESHCLSKKEAELLKSVSDKIAEMSAEEVNAFYHRIV